MKESSEKLKVADPQDSKSSGKKKAASRKRSSLDNVLVVAGVFYVISYFISLPAGAARFYAMCLNVRLPSAYAIVFGPVMLGLLTALVPDKSKKMVGLVGMLAIGTLQIAATAKLTIGGCKPSLLQQGEKYAKY